MLSTLLPHTLTRSPQRLFSALLNAPPQPLPPAERFIVLVPDAPVHEAHFARDVWELAHARQTPLVFVTRVAHPQRALRARRRLATLASLARDMHNRVEILVVTQPWLEAVRAIWQPGDLTLCHAEQTVSHWGRRQTLAERLVTQLNLPVYLFSGYYPELNRPSPPDWTRALFFDLTAAGTVILCLLLQLELQHITPVWLRQLLLVLVIALEFGGLAMLATHFLEGVSHD